MPFLDGSVWRLFRRWLFSVAHPFMMILTSILTHLCQFAGTVLDPDSSWLRLPGAPVSRGLRGRLAILVGLLLVAASQGFAAEEEPKIAVLAAPAAENAGAILLAEFSAGTFAEFVEREGIDAILQETNLAISMGSDALRVGQLVGADGILFLEEVAEGEQRLLATHLIATRPGVVLDVVRVPWDIAQKPGWSEPVGARLRPHLSKLKLPEKEAIPLSMVGLRSAIDASSSLEVERELTLLLENRLATEPDVLLLERKRMDALMFEKHLLPDEEEFWAGSYLIEGSIDAEGYDRDRITVQTRLTSPRGRAAVPLEVEGARENLPTVADLLARKILERIKGQPPTTDWQIEEEAERFHEDAVWSLRWGIIDAARAAAESSWALGKRDMETALARLRSYTETTWPDANRFQEGSVTFGSSDGPTVEIKTLNLLKIPDQGNLESAHRALSFFHEANQVLPRKTVAATSEWHRTAVKALEAASRVLQHFHFAPRYQEPVQEELVEVRSLARQAAEWLGREAAASNSTEAFDECKRSWGHFWQEGPEESVKFLTELMQSPTTPLLPGFLVNRDARNPLLVAWNEPDRERTDEVWRSHLGDLLTSPEWEDRLEGQILQLVSAGTSQWLASETFRAQPKAKPFNRHLNQLKRGGYAAFVQHEEMEKALEALLKAIEENRALLPKRFFGRRNATSDWERALFSGRQSPAKERASERFRKDLRPEVQESFATRTTSRRDVVSGKREAEETPDKPGVTPEFVPLLIDEPEHLRVAEFSITSHVLHAGVLWVDATIRWKRLSGAYSGTSQGILAGFDLEGQTWRTIPYKVTSRRRPTFAVWQGDLYRNSAEGFQRFEQETDTWKTLSLPAQPGALLFAVHDRLFSCDENTIREILDGGRQMQLLASTRRRPSVTSLDTLASLGAPVVLPGADEEIRVYVGDTVYALKGDEWEPVVEVAPRSDLKSDPQGALLSSDSDLRTWRLPRGSDSLELLLDQRPRNNTRFRSDLSPRWEQVDVFPGSAATLLDDGLLVFQELASVEYGGDPSPRIVTPEGSHGELLWLSPDHSRPASVPVQFEPFIDPSKFKRVADRRGTDMKMVWKNQQFSLVSASERILILHEETPGIWFLDRKRISRMFERSTPSPADSARTK